MARFWAAVLAALLYSTSANAQFNEAGPLIGQRSQAIGVPSVPYTGPVIVPSSETTIQGFGSCDSGCSATIPATVAGHAYVMRIVNFNPSTGNGFSMNPSVTGTSLGATCTFRSQGGTVTTNTVVTYFLVCENISGGVTTASLQSTGSTGDLLSVLGYEISNVPTSGVFDIAGSNTNGAGGGTNVSCNLTGNTSQTSELILSSAFGYNTTVGTTSTPGWTIIPGQSGDYYNNGVSTGNYTVAFVGSGATQMACAEVALKHP